MNWRDEVDRISKLVDPEYMTVRRAIDIGELWEQLRPKRILEIGTYKGTGACYLGAMAACYGGSVWTVDLPWTGQHNAVVGSLGLPFSVVAEEQLEKCGVTNVTVIRRDDGSEGWFHDFFQQRQSPLDFVFLDGGHQWLNTAAQFAMAMAALRVGGWICVDDLLDKQWVECGFVWRHLILPTYACRFERGVLGFVMRTQATPCPFRCG